MLSASTSLIFFLLPLIMVSSFSTTTDKNSATASSSAPSYRLRKFDVDKDMEAIHDICKDVYGGADYLPKTAPILANDSNSTFVVLADITTDRPAAVGNARRFKPNMSWLEAIRTCPDHRSRGLARQLTASLIKSSHSEHGDAMYSCTVASNVAMRKVFERTNMKELGQIHQCSFAELKKLPGWAADGSAGDNDDDDMASSIPPRPLLPSLGIADEMISNQAKQMQLAQISSEVQLNEDLALIKAKGGIGHLVGLYELLPDDGIRKSLDANRVWKVSTTTNPDDFALLALVHEAKISSLKSPWVCSISATSMVALEGALWNACSDHCLRMIAGHFAFTVAFDVCGEAMDGQNGIVPVTVKALPLSDDACLLFGSTDSL